MALGKRQPQQGELFVATTDLPPAPGLPFYTQLNDSFIEELRAPHYVAAGHDRPSIPRIDSCMLFVGYFEGLDSQRGIAWRCRQPLAATALWEVVAVSPTSPTIRRGGCSVVA